MFGSSLVVMTLRYFDSVKCYIHDDNMFGSWMFVSSLVVITLHYCDSVTYMMTIRLDHGCLAVALWLYHCVIVTV